MECESTKKDEQPDKKGRRAPARSAYSFSIIECHSFAFAIRSLNGTVQGFSHTVSDVGSLERQ